MEQQLITAIESRAWYSLAGLLVTLLLRLWSALAPRLSERIPRRWQWVPAVAVSSLAAFVDQQVAGAHWLVALGMAVYAAVSAGGVAIGAYHTVKRVAGQ